MNDHFLQIFVGRTAAIIHLIVASLGTHGIGACIEEFEVFAIERDDGLGSLARLDAHSLVSLEGLQRAFGIGRVFHIDLHNLGTILLSHIADRDGQGDLLALLQCLIRELCLPYII